MLTFLSWLQVSKLERKEKYARDTKVILTGRKVEHVQHGYVSSVPGVCFTYGVRSAAST